MKIQHIQAYPVSFPVPPAQSVRLGIGRSVKRDAVLVQVQTDEGLVGWGEAHHGRCPGAIAKLIDTTLSDLVVGQEATDTQGVWQSVYKMQIASHGLGAGAAMALSGLDMALWDIRCQMTDWPLYRLLGGRSKPIKAYAGGIALGWQPTSSLVEEAQAHVANGYRAIKLRVGDTPALDIERVTAVRRALGNDIEILTDANTNYSLADARRVMPAFAECGVVWLEEPFPAHDRHAYRSLARMAPVTLASGENHYTRYEFETLMEDDCVGYVQPDISKTGGITETMRIAAMASAKKLTCNPHTSLTALNMAASLHVLAAIDNPGYFEGDVTTLNPFRDLLGGQCPYALDAAGCVKPPEGSGVGVGFGVTVDLDFINAHPLIEGPCYV
jgi:D-galactarolactone cycloisomerase